MHRKFSKRNRKMTYLISPSFLQNISDKIKRQSERYFFLRKIQKYPCYKITLNEHYISIKYHIFSFQGNYLKIK